MSLGFLSRTISILIQRENGFIIPHGTIRILGNDGLMVLGPENTLEKAGKVQVIAAEEE